MPYLQVFCVSPAGPAGTLSSLVWPTRFWQTFATPLQGAANRPRDRDPASTDFAEHQDTGGPSSCGPPGLPRPLGRESSPESMLYIRLDAPVGRRTAHAVRNRARMSRPGHLPVRCPQRPRFREARRRASAPRAITTHLSAVRLLSYGRFHTGNGSFLGGAMELHAGLQRRSVRLAFVFLVILAIGCWASASASATSADTARAVEPHGVPSTTASSARSCRPG